MADIFDGYPAPPSWLGLRHQATSTRLLEFLMPTTLTTVTAAVAAAVKESVRGADPVEAAEGIAARVRAQVS